MKKILTSDITFGVLVTIAISGLALGCLAINVEHQPAGSLNLLWILVALSICGITLRCWAQHDFILWIIITNAIVGFLIALCWNIDWVMELIFWIYAAADIVAVALWLWSLLQPKNQANNENYNHDDIIKKK